MVILPQGWGALDGLVCGFGGRGDVLEYPEIIQVTQIHGNLLVAAEDVAPDAGGSDIAPTRADAMSIRSNGLVAAIRTADCVPILMVAPRERWAAVVHAGWRGTVADIGGVAVRAATHAGVTPSSLLAAIGPAIGPCCYEVGEDVASRFDELGLAVMRDRAKPSLDLREINRRRLLDAGLSDDRIQVCGPCTRCHSDRYWSFRADGEKSGRQLSWVGWEDQTRGTDR